jgi:hypothetical protein
MKSLTVKSLIALFVCTSFILSCTNPSQKEKTNSEPATESQWISLFNGENLDGWYSYQMRPEPTSEVSGLNRDEEGNYLEPIGLNNDPLQVFSAVMEEEAPAIRMSGKLFYRNIQIRAIDEIPSELWTNQ